MTPTLAGPPVTARKRDAAASRDRLLQAAGELFEARGYDRTTARDIGQLAGVDPAMIARYFGGKAQLYIEVLHARFGDAPPEDLLERSRLAFLLGAARNGPGPVYQSAMRPYDDVDAQAAARAELHARLIVPLRERLQREGTPNSELRAEVLTAAFIGVILARTSSAFDLLPTADTEQLLDLLHELMLG
jgi:AcrR family transcriptional regulator